MYSPKFENHLQSMLFAFEVEVDAGLFVGAFVGLRVGGFAVGVVGVGAGPELVTFEHFPKVPNVAVLMLLTEQQSLWPVVAHL